MASIDAHELTFRVELERVVKLASNVWAEGNGLKALALLTQGFEGIDVGLAENLIIGTVTVGEVAELFEREHRYDAEALF